MWILSQNTYFSDFKTFRFSSLKLFIIKYAIENQALSFIG